MNITKLFAASVFAAAMLASPAWAKGQSCCEKAKAAGKQCAHTCCVAATKAGKVCAKCNAVKETK